MVRVSLPNQISGTLNRSFVELDAEGELVSVLESLLSACPSLKQYFIVENDTIPAHIAICINNKLIHSAKHPISADDTIEIIHALSGG